MRLLGIRRKGAGTTKTSLTIKTFTKWVARVILCVELSATHFRTEIYMSKIEPLALQAIIPDKASAIAFDGGAGDKCRLVLDLFSEQPAEFLKLLKLRGERLIVTFVKEDDIHQGG